MRQGEDVSSPLRRAFLAVWPAWLAAGLSTLGLALLTWPLADATGATGGWDLYAAALAVGVSAAVVTAIEFESRVLSRTEKSVTLRLSMRSGRSQLTKIHVAVLIAVLLVAPGFIGAAFKNLSDTLVAAITVLLANGVYLYLRLAPDMRRKKRARTPEMAPSEPEPVAAPKQSDLASSYEHAISRAPTVGFPQKQHRTDGEA
jgi:hypothetical protein